MSLIKLKLTEKKNKNKKNDDKVKHRPNIIERITNTGSSKHVFCRMRQI